MKTKLTPEQSQRLIELGVNPSKASENTEYGAWADSEHGKPIFALADILSLLPKEICDTEIWKDFYLTIESDCYNTWLATYREYCGDEIMMEIGEKVAPELIDALFELLCWILKNHPDKIKQT